MSVDQSQLDLNTLQWVKSEIDTTLKQARSALELHVESPEDSTQLKLISSFLHQIRGTLIMVELYGASMLAEELELLAGDIASKKVEGRDDIYEVMMQAMWQLPDYLERLQAGYKDIPMVLLPLLNDLRAARGQPLLSESALFSPNLNVDIPVMAIDGGEPLPSLAKRLRHTYHLGLLDWFRERDTRGGLKKLDSVIEKLRQSANDAEVNRVLWSASGVLEALKQGGIEPSVAVKLLMGQVDRQIKKIIDHGENALSSEPPAELEKNLLYYIASSTSTGERVNEIKQKFKLSDALPDAETLEQARIDLTGPNAELMQTVSTVLLDDLLQIKDSLDVIVRADEKDLSLLPKMADGLSQVADTLGMLGFGKQRQTIQEQATVLREVASEERLLDEKELVGVAEVLLSVETLLEGNVVNPNDPSVELDLNDEINKHQLVDSVITEARTNMSKVKEALSTYLDMPRNTSLISEVPELLDQIRGSFQILDMVRAAELIEACRNYIQKGMLESKRSQDPAQMEALADAISSIEYYMDSVSGKWGNPEAILKVAEERLNDIGIFSVAPEAVETDEQAASSQEQTDTKTDLEQLDEHILQSDDTMIDLGSMEFNADQESTDLMDIELSDMSTAELSLAEFEKGLEHHQSEKQQDDASEADEDSHLISMDGMLDPLATEADENNTQEIDLSSALLEQSESIELQGLEEEKSTDTQEIDFDSALAELDKSIEAFTTGISAEAEQESGLAESIEDTSNQTQEIEFDSAILELDEKDTSENVSNETQEIDFDSTILELDTSVDGSDNAINYSGLADIEELELEPLPDSFLTPAEEKSTETKLTPPVSTTEIDSQLAVWYADASNKKLARKLQKDLKTIKQFAKSTEQEDISKIAKDMIAVIKAVQDGESELTDDIRNIMMLAQSTLKELFDADAEQAVTVETTQPVRQKSETKPGEVEPVQPEAINDAKAVSDAIKGLELPDEIDNEIAEIFIEEAREEHANISRLLPIWQANHSDEESLREIRRSFHTLKGSGRLVGATDVGEFAWAFENMLNRVLDHTVEPADTMFDLIDRAIDTLPTLMEMYLTGQKPGQDIFTLIEQAESLSQGKDISVSDLSTVILQPGISDETLVMEKPELDIPDNGVATPVIDETLLDIYRKEVDSHLATLHSYIEGWRDNIDRSANDKLLRAVHTLTGCSRTATVNTLAELFGETEKYVKQLDAGQSSVSEDAVKFLIRCIDTVEQTLSVLGQSGTVLPGIEDLLTEIHALQASCSESDKSFNTDSNVTRLKPVKNTVEPEITARAEYDEELLSIFVEEAVEILDESDQLLHQWSDNKQNPEFIPALQRLLHTLKGGARLAGLSIMGDLSHSIESMLEAMLDTGLEMTDEAYDILIAAQDKLVNMLEQAKQLQPLTPAEDIIGTVNFLLGKENFPEDPALNKVTQVEQEPELVLVEEADVEDTTGEHLPDNVVPLGTLAKIENRAPAVTVDEHLPAERPAAKELVRVHSELLDNLVNFAGEVSIYRSRMEQQTTAFRYNLQELDDTVNRLREQLRKFEMEAEAQIQYRAEESFSHSHEDFDPLEFDRFTQMQQLSRGMMESLNDLDSLRAILSGLTRESETLLVQQSRVNTELQEGLMRTRMVPFNSQANRLRRIVRQTAEEMGKQAELHLHGADSEIDRTVLERMLPALEHMLRNAVAHGLENPTGRKAANKADMGQVNLSLSREGGDIVLTLTDDGQGIDLDAIQNKAIEKGKLNPDSNITREILFDIIMESGFSTADEVTQIAGRGVGMDVVNNEIKQLGGLLKIDTEQGKGSSFTISLPLTLSLTRALMVQVGEESYALPLLSVEGVERVTVEQLQDLYHMDIPVFQWLGKDYPFLHLGSAMGLSKRNIPTDRSRIPLLLVRSGEYCAAVQVDNLIGSREIVVKPVGPQLSTMRGIAGATIMGDGSVVLIIDLGVLIRASALQEEMATRVVQSTSALIEPEKERQPLIMVIDDSITVRKVTTRLLERNNYRSVSAKDGVDALAQLQEIKPDIMLLDVEMPRMDGFELATNVRNDDKLKDIPIIMITSRTGQKHRDRAEKIGVNMYMGKPYSEAELLDNIQSLIETRH
ncbi:MAG: Hpt domain-containing protein [Gammaproteobacteria bacterium]|nr:Hpt domain-containing protein [Gammaproteobacteria bacterium]